MKFNLIAISTVATLVGASGFAQTSTRIGVTTPVYSFERQTSYSSSQAQFDRAYESRIRDLNAGRNFYNDRSGQVRTTTDTHTIGGSVMGFGASHSVTGQPSSRSAAENALHTYDRTAHLRALSGRSGRTGSP